MDHDTIEQQHTVQRYLMGKLSAEEAARFEEHYLDCAECLEELGAAGSLTRGLKGLTARQLAVTAARVSLWARLRRAGLVATLVILALLPAGWLYRRAERLEGDLERTRATPAAEPAGGQESSQALEQEIAALRQELASTEAERRHLAERLERTQRPLVNVPLALLSPVRSTPGADAPPTQLHLSSSQERIVLEIEVDEPLAPRYRATLTREGEEVWSSGGLAPNDFGHLLVSFPTSFFAPGDHLLRVEGMTAEGEVASTYPFAFRVVAGDG